MPTPPDDDDDPTSPALSAAPTSPPPASAPFAASISAAPATSLRSSIDLSNGIVWDPKDRASYHEAIDNLVVAESAMEKRLAAHAAVGMARTMIDNALLVSPVPPLVERMIMAVLDELIKELAP